MNHEENFHPSLKLVIVEAVIRIVEMIVKAITEKLSFRIGGDNKYLAYNA